MIHCGSRGLGHQVASDYIQSMEDAFGIKGLPDRELIHAPVQSPLGRQYYQSMCAAVNYAFANRQMIAHWVRDVFRKVLGSSRGMRQVYDVCHNVAKIEPHLVDGTERRLCVHRKGATRSFGPGRPEIPEAYRTAGQPVIIPGSMGTASYLLVGTAESEDLSWSSTAHGAGRVMSRQEAIRRFRGEKIRDDLARKGIELQATSWKGIAEEAAEAYKDVDEVVAVSDAVGLGRLVARVVPIGVMKG
jgi:tRNA-splicing ligase RtcB